PGRGRARQNAAPVSTRRGRRRSIGVAPLVVIALVPFALALGPARPSNGQTASPPPGRRPPRPYLIHLTHGGDPIVVDAYSEDGVTIVFEKSGGLAAIPPAHDLP